MSNFDFKKIVTPSVFLLIAIALLVFSLISYNKVIEIDTKSTSYALAAVLGAVTIVLMAGIQFLFALGILNKLLLKPVVSYVVIGVLSLISISFVFGNYKSYERRQVEIDTFKARKKSVIDKLDDIAEIQKVIKKETGQYAASFEALVEFMKNHKVAEVTKTVINALPAELDTMSEANQALAGYIKFDTTYVNALEKYFTSEAITLERLEAKKPKFDTERLDDLKLVPFSSGDNGEALEFIFRSDSTKDEMLSKMMVTFEVVDPQPNGEVKDDSLRIGDLGKTSANGNWTND